MQPGAKGVTVEASSRHTRETGKSQYEGVLLGLTSIDRDFDRAAEECISCAK